MTPRCTISVNSYGNLVSQARPSHVKREGLVWGHQYICVRDITRIWYGPIRSQYGLSRAFQAPLMFAIRNVKLIRGNYCNAMFIKRQKLHSVRSTGTATAILMSPFYVRWSGSARLMATVLGSRMLYLDKGLVLSNINLAITRNDVMNNFAYNRLHDYIDSDSGMGIKKQKIYTHICIGKNSTTK